MRELRELTLRDQVRFLQKAEIAESGCWIWKACRNKAGYGVFQVGSVACLAHRASYALFVSPALPDETIDHLCRNPACVNPEHLEPVSLRENIRRGTQGTTNRIKRACPAGHEYSPSNTRVYRGRRHCRRCDAIRNLRNYHEARAHAVA